MTVAVATGVEGYTSLSVMWPALAFHMMVSIAGAQMLLAAARRADAEKPAQEPSADTPVAPAV